MNAAPKTHGKAFAANHNGYADRLDAMAKRCAEARQSAEYRAYLTAHLPKEDAPVREP